jgi:hypothetical protein
MFVYIALLITLALAGIAVYLSFRIRPSARLLSLAIGLFVHLYGAWIFLSVWGKYVLAIWMIGSIGMWIAMKPKTLLPRNKRWLPGQVILSIVFFALSILYFTGTTGPAQAVELPFPLHRGKYAVFQGGRGLPTNVFHVSSRNAIYAIDLVRLNRFGNRANSIFSKRLEDYAIFGDTVFAPCAGLISGSRDENPDNIPPERKRGPSNLNAVSIETPQFHVFIGHLKQGGVFVKEGDVVQAGQPIGLVGNSGMSIEPHLHIQVHRNSGRGLPWYREDPMLIHFDGEEYRLFEVITPKEVPMKNPNP